MDGGTSGPLVAPAPPRYYEALGGYDENIPDYRDGRCFPLVRQHTDVGPILRSKMRAVLPTPTA
jgi:hypothetical protein